MSSGLASKRWAATSNTLAPQLPGAVQRRPSGHGRRPAAARHPHRDDVGVADDDAHLIERHPELVGGDLGQRGLVTLAVRHLAREDGHGAVLFEPEPHLLGAHDSSALRESSGPGAASM